MQKIQNSSLLMILVPFLLILGRCFSALTVSDDCSSTYKNKKSQYEQLCCDEKYLGKSLIKHNNRKKQYFLCPKTIPELCNVAGNVFAFL